MAVKKLTAKEEKELDDYIFNVWPKGEPLEAEQYTEFKNEFLALKKTKKSGTKKRKKSLTGGKTINIKLKALRTQLHKNDVVLKKIKKNIDKLESRYK